MSPCISGSIPRPAPRLLIVVEVSPRSPAPIRRSRQSRAPARKITDSEIDQTLAFYRSCGAARSTFELAAWVTPASVERLVRRGFHIAGAENVVFCHLPVETVGSAFPIAEWEASQWVDLMLIAWECPQTPAWRHLAQAAAHLPDAVNLGVSLDGIQACGQLVPSEDFAIFGCDATATASRGRGIQTALIQERLRHAVERGFSTAIAEVAPNSTSEHNYLRCGFRVAYTRTHYTLEIA